MARRRGFTLVEALVAGALAIVVLGGALLLYVQGNRMFQTTTEHASAREEALLILERMNKDLETLMVSDEIDPVSGTYYMLRPYRLTGGVEQVAVDPVTGERMKTIEYTGLQFHVYHHTQNTKDPDGEFPLPQLVGRLIEYKLEPIAGDPRKGHNLLRNGVKLNRQPLDAVFFRRADPVFARGNIGASPDAVLDVYVIPHGGMWGTMSEPVISGLVARGHALMRTFHLVGYESQFTTLLSLSDNKARYGEALDPLEQAVVDHAKEQNLLASSGGRTRGPALEYRLPAGRVKLEDALYDAATAGDPECAAAPSEAGVQSAGKTESSGITLSSGSTSSRVTL